MEAFNPYVWGPINWNGRKLNAVIISGLTRENIEDGPLAGLAASRVLAENPDLSEPPAKWAVFASVGRTGGADGFRRQTHRGRRLGWRGLGARRLALAAMAAGRGAWAGAAFRR